jgi:dTDP-D-glucose 4,6-dehydratase
VVLDSLTYAVNRVTIQPFLDAGRLEHWRFLHVSTDEVFGSLAPANPPLCETTAYNPRSPYSASKVASDHLARAWQHSYGLPMQLSQHLITIVNDCAGHDRRYAIEASKIDVKLGWRPQVSVQEAWRRALAWYLTHQDWWQPQLSRSRGV